MKTLLLRFVLWLFDATVEEVTDRPKPLPAPPIMLHLAAVDAILGARLCHEPKFSKYACLRWRA